MPHRLLDHQAAPRRPAAGIERRAPRARLQGRRAGRVLLRRGGVERLLPGLVAGASLLVDYTLTVAVSLAAGTAAITSAIEPLRQHGVTTALVLLTLITVANLRGVRESGQLFAPPTYGYVAMMVLFLGYGLLRTVFGDLGPLPVDTEALNEATHNGTMLGAASLFLLMRATPRRCTPTTCSP